MTNEIAPTVVNDEGISVTYPDDNPVNTLGMGRLSWQVSGIETVGKVDVEYIPAVRTRYKKGQSAGAIKHDSPTTLRVQIDRPWNLADDDMDQDLLGKIEDLMKALGEQTARQVAQLMAEATGEPVQHLDEEFREAWYASHPGWEYEPVDEHEYAEAMAEQATELTSAE